MKIYLAAANIRQYNCVKSKKNINVLLSYHYWKSDLNINRIKNRINKEADNIFIDSGAFSAFNSNKEISLKKYCNFIKEVKSTNYASLDVIGDGEKTYYNTLRMQDKGLNPIPTFHTFSKEKHLYKLLDFDYIALGGMVGAKNIDIWLQKVWKIILENKPNLKVHGFGLTDVAIVKKYPWYSIDSTSWHTIGRNGTIQLWNTHKNKFYRMTADEYKYKNKLNCNNSELEIIGDSESAKDFQYFEDYLNTITNYSHITAQKSIF
jgi:hypothetical protein